MNASNIVLRVLMLGCLCACAKSSDEGEHADPASNPALRDVPAQTAPEITSTQPKPAQEAQDKGPLADAKREAEAEFIAAPGVKLRGKAQLNELPEGVRVEVEVQDAPPGPKGIHVHQKADCSDIPGKSMGEHFAPEGESHGLPSSPAHHLGDLGNIEIGKDGKGRLEITAPGANLKPDDPHSFLGKALVIHETRDTGKPPTGESGKPIACAPIKPDQ